MDSKRMEDTINKLKALSTVDLKLQLSLSTRQLSDLQYLIDREKLAIQRGRRNKPIDWVKKTQYQCDQLGIKIKEIRATLHSRLMFDHGALSEDKAARFMRIAESQLKPEQFIEIHRLVTQEIASEKKMQRLETARQARRANATH